MSLRPPSETIQALSLGFDFRAKRSRGPPGLMEPRKFWFVVWGLNQELVALTGREISVSRQPIRQERRLGAEPANRKMDKHPNSKPDERSAHPRLLGRDRRD